MKQQSFATYVIFRKFMWRALLKTSVCDLLISYVSNVHEYARNIINKCTLMNTKVSSVSLSAGYPGTVASLISSLSMASSGPLPKNVNRQKVHSLRSPAPCNSMFVYFIS